MSDASEKVGWVALYGAVLAMILSWDRNHAILWALLHGFLNWIYVIYFAITRDLPPGT